MKRRIRKKTSGALIYCRSASSNQSGEDLQVMKQEEICKRMATADNVRVDMVIQDKGCSGSNLERTGIKEVIKLTRQGKVNVIYITHPDRLSRNMMDFLKLERFFKRKKVIIKTLSNTVNDLRDALISSVTNAVLKNN